MEFVHKPVLLNECITGLNIKEDGTYVDCTVGGGGHSFQIVSRLNKGMLIGFDADPQAIEAASEKLKDFNCKLFNTNYSNIKQCINEININKIDGILMDLGVSSHQLDTEERGFSYHGDAPLDMRMSKAGLSARDVINDYSNEDLMRIIYAYGEEKYAKSIVQGIIKSRESAPIETTSQLAEIIKNNVPISVRKQKNPCRKTFQAIRIEVNSELDNLKKALTDGFEILSPGGRMAVITFHSLEDRIVKTFFREMSTGCTCPSEFPVCVCNKEPKGILMPKKAISPSVDELAENPRSRSAKLRIIEKCL